MTGYSRKKLELVINSSQSLSQLKLNFSIHGLNYPEDKWHFAKYVSGLFHSFSHNNLLQSDFHNWLIRNVNDIVTIDMARSWLFTMVVKDEILPPLNSFLLKEFIKKNGMKVLKK